MSVQYILQLAGAKMGLNPDDSSQRPTLIRFLNEAAIELYQQTDITGTLMEQVFKINGDQTLTLPNYVGQVRAVRESASMQVWHINKMRPRYNQFNWTDMWRNIRIKNRQALMATVTNQSVGIVTVEAVENPVITVTVTGPTETAESVSETLTMDAVSKTTTNVFLNYTSVTKNRTNNYDVTLSDVDGKVLTVIPNNEKEALYQILDVSACPWLPQNTSKFDNYMEVLYKKKLQWLTNDSDEFPAPNCEHILVNKILQLWAEEQGKGDVAIAYDNKATRSLARLMEDQNKETENMVALVANPHDTMLKRIGTGLRRRYGLYAGRKY